MKLTIITQISVDGVMQGNGPSEVDRKAGFERDVIDPGSDPIADAFNTKPKYLASSNLTEPQWTNTTVLSGDLAAAVKALKADSVGELQVHGSGDLVRWLLDNDLVDELDLLVFPVVVGQGTRLFPDTGPDLALDLVESRAFPKGITLQVYRPTGRPQYASAAAEPST